MGELYIPSQARLHRRILLLPNNHQPLNTVFFRHKVDYFLFLKEQHTFQVYTIKNSRQTQMQLSAARGIPQLGLSKQNRKLERALAALLCGLG